MMNMCKEMMGNRGVDSMMQKGMGMAQNCMGSTSRNDGETSEVSRSKEIPEAVKVEIKTKNSAETS